MLENRIKHLLQRDQAIFGVGLTGPAEVPVLRVLAQAGVEWVFLDLEHGSMDISGLLPAVQMLDALGVCSVLRIPSLDYHWVARALDTGALSVMVPRVESAAQAATAVQWAKFPPMGVRGMGSPSYLSYAPVSVADGVKISNRETMVVVQIESVAGVENVETIAAVPGVDVLFIGPLDLSISLGRPGDVASDESHRLFQRVCAAARAYHLAVGVVCQASQVRFYYDMGIRMFSVGTALTHLRAGVQGAAAEFRRQLGG